MNGLENVKVGDKVSVMFSHWGMFLKGELTVDRVSPTLVICGNTRISIKNGNEHGNGKYQSTNFYASTHEFIVNFKKQKAMKEELAAMIEKISHTFNLAENKTELIELIEKAIEAEKCYDFDFCKV